MKTTRREAEGGRSPCVIGLKLFLPGTQSAVITAVSLRISERIYRRGRSRERTGARSRGAFRVATFSGLMITVRGERAAKRADEGPGYRAASRALTSRVVPSISRNPPCRFYRLEIYYTAGPRPAPPRLSSPLPRSLSRRRAEMRRQRASRSMAIWHASLPYFIPVPEGEIYPTDLYFLLPLGNRAFVG